MGLFGIVSATGILKNINMSNAKVINDSSGTNGKISSGIIASHNAGIIQGCSVTGSTLSLNNTNTDAGLIVAYDSGYIFGCTVTNSTISGYRALGGIVGSCGGQCVACIAKDITITCNSSYTSQCSPIIGYDDDGSSTACVSSNYNSDTSLKYCGGNVSAFYNYTSGGTTMNDATTINSLNGFIATWNSSNTAHPCPYTFTQAVTGTLPILNLN